jgi:putative ATP-dependent endonuclease of the OLD family
VEVSKLKIENFRGIETLTIDLGPSTVLIGANNVGKTSVLRALDFVLGRQAGRGGRISDYDHRREGEDRDLPDGHQVTITATFIEKEEGQWDASAARALNDVIQIDDDERRTIVARLHDTYDAKAREFDPEFKFLNLQGDELVRTPVRELRAFVPAFYLSAERRASSDFSGGARFWAPFLRDPTLDDDVRRQLEANLRKVGDEVTNASPDLVSLRKSMEGAKGMIDLKKDDPVSLEPLATRLPELLRRTEVRLTTPHGASIPLDRHGGGAQNAAVLYLFQAYLAAALASEYEETASPVLALEEPEAHLHPAATSAAWNVLGKMKGQKIVATHSGELLSLVPLSSIRRLVRTDTGIEVRRVKAGTLDKDEERKIDFHIRRARGELLFGDVWLLGEGESEYWVLTGAAEALGINLEQEGIRIVECLSQSGGPRPLIKVADDLGIGWHCMVDGDEGGERFASAVRALLGNREQDPHLTVLKYERLEHLLCEEGFGKLYEAKLSNDDLQDIPPLGRGEHWAAVAKKFNAKRKVRMAVEVADRMRAGETSVPPTLRDILQAALKLTP